MYEHTYTHAHTYRERETDGEEYTQNITAKAHRDEPVYNYA